MQPKLTPEQRQAAEAVRDMLGPDKLGGADRTFNYGDVSAVTQGLLRDRQGLSQQVRQQLEAEGRPLKARIASNSLTRRQGPIRRRVAQEVYQQAAPQIRGQVNQGLAEARVDPGTAAAPDPTPRNLTFGEVESFERNARVLQRMQAETEQRLGIQIDFPQGMSQDAIQHMLDGKLGFPPGAVVKPRK
ncbi:MAG: hypothetical protein H6730_27325 [Deltaproteobacteria bacterium]|nr:hypothetical protein [Deltaproteobacteria bacterium]